MDRRGRRGVILTGGVLNTIVCSLYLTLHAMGPWVYVLRMLHGLAEAMLFTSLFTVAADLVPAGRRTEGIALFGVSGMLPVALGGLLGDALLARSGFAALFEVAAGFAAASLLLSLPLREPPRAGPGGEPARGFFSALSQPDLLPLWWMGTLFAVALAASFAFVRRMVDDTGIGSVGGFFGAYAASAIVLRLFFGWLPERVGPKRLLYPALATLAAGFLALAGAGSARDVMLAGALCGAGHGYVFPILFGLVVSRARDADRGSATAVFTALFDIGVVVGGPLFGGIARSRGFPGVYAAAAGVVVLGAAGFSLWDRRR
jgi:predicted MFS family arabinose efflux permease